MTEFSFGQSPIADNCPAITISCIFDEVPGEQQPLPRWFEVMGGNSIFDIVVDPVDYDKMMNHEFD
jgi:UDP-N-acetyl-D-mannosaminuronic acid transferase (WecB/TagA/CpsF family)